MNDQIATVTIKILNKAYQVKCPKSQVAQLELAGVYLNEKIEEIKAQSPLMSIENTLLMAALNISSSLLIERSSANYDQEALSVQLKNLTEQLTDTLTAHEDGI